MLVIAAMARTAWRIWRHNEQLEPGGSYGRQSFGRYREPTFEDDRQRAPSGDPR